MAKKNIYVIGHKNPDSDSICAAIGLAELKQMEGMENVMPARAGDLNPQTSFLLDYFNIQPPKYLSDVYPRAKDIMSDDIAYINEDTPLLKVMELIQERRVRFIPVVDSLKRPTGILTLVDIAKEYISYSMPENPKNIFTSVKNIGETLNAKIVQDLSKSTASFYSVLVGAMEEDSFLRFLMAKDPAECIIIVGDRENIQQLSIEKGVGLLIIAGGLPLSDTVVEAARRKGVSIIISPFDSAATAFLVRLSIPAAHIAGREFEKASLDDLAEELKRRLAQSPENGFMVLDSLGIIQGVITKSNLLREPETNLILVDHNEITQAIDGADKVTIQEVLDHHRLGNFHTIHPIPFVCEPVGSTSTLVAEQYRSRGIAIKQTTAGLLLGGVLSDTVILKSPTTTERDISIVQWLEEKAGLEHKKFGAELFAATSSIKNIGINTAVTSDYKIYEVQGKKFGVGQIETVGFSEFHEVKEEIRNALRLNADKEGLVLSALLITDIVAGTSLMLATGANEVLSSLGYPEIEGGVYELKNILSRKKQVTPHLLSLFNALYR